MKILSYFRRFTLLIFIAFISSLNAVQFENQPIQEIKVVGNIDETLFLARMKTKSGDFFSQNIFDNDLKNLAAEYDRVEPSFEFIDKKLFITLTVSPKPQIRLIEWNGNVAINAKDLQKELGISICTVFDRVSFNKAFHKLKAYYIKKGYFEAELNYSIKIDSKTNEVDIAISICEGRSGWISRIYFENFSPEEECEILEMMVTKKYNPFFSWMTNEGLYNEEAIHYDQSQIVNYLHDKGYADAQVKIQAVDSPHFKERIHLYITAQKGEVYTIGKLAFSGNTLFSDEEIQNCFVVEEGGCFSPELLRATTTKIEHLYGKKGYIDASVSFEPRLEIECDSVYSVDFMIEEGEKFHVGMIKVFGNCITQTNVILHETLLIPGEVFNSQKMEATEARLKNVGYFSNVNVYAVRAEEGSCLKGNYRDVHIEVEEKQTGRFGLFFGYSTVEAIFGGVNITESNFNSAGLGSLFCKNGPGLRGGGEHVNITASIGQKTSSYGLGWTKPYFMDSRWSVGFDIEKTTNQYISEDYDIKALSYNLRATRGINAFTRFGLHYRISNSHVHFDNAHSHGHEKNQTETFFDGCKELCEASHIHGLISAIGWQLSYDSTNRIDLPSCGLRSIFEMEYVGVGGDHTFFSFGYLNSYYIPITECGTLKLRGDFKFIRTVGHTGFNDIPLDERLFLGGDNVMRGYKSYKLGPLFCGDHDPKGGASMQILSMEYNHTLFSRLNGFLFIDGGALTEKAFSIGAFYLSYGLGVRLKVMDSFPPITLGLGFPVNHKKGRTKNFFMNFGGSF